MSTLPEVVVALLEGAGKTIEGLGSSDESQKEVKSWLERIGEGKFEKEDEIKVRLSDQRLRVCWSRACVRVSGLVLMLVFIALVQSLDGELSSKTYLVGSSLTSADLSLFAALRPYLVRPSSSSLISTNH